MAADSNIQDAAVAVDSNTEVERLLAEVASGTAGAGVAADEKKETVSAYDRNATFLSPQQLRKLQQHQEKFVMDLSSRLSVLLRVEVLVKLAAIQTVSYRRMEQSWPEAVHLTVFRVDSLKGHGVLAVPSPLGLSMIDRLMGGSGTVLEAGRKLSDIEGSLMEQIVQTLLANWCGHWSRLRELKPVIIGHETSGRFIQQTPPQTNMMAVLLSLEIGELQERILLSLPYLSMEPLIRQLANANEGAVEAPPPAPPAPVRWNPCFDEVPVRVSANWPHLEVAAGDVLQLKVGDILSLNPQCAQTVTVLVGNSAKFTGRLGTINGRWAVEVTQVIRP